MLPAARSSSVKPAQVDAGQVDPVVDIFLDRIAVPVVRHPIVRPPGTPAQVSAEEARIDHAPEVSGPRGPAPRREGETDLEPERWRSVVTLMRETLGDPVRDPRIEVRRDRVDSDEQLRLFLGDMLTAPELVSPHHRGEDREDDRHLIGGRLCE